MLSRAEASPFPWDELTHDQQKTVRNVAQLFGELAQQPWDPPPPRGRFDRFLVPLDLRRRNHVALIEGERGIGKTVVLLTLLAVWGAAERGEPKGLGGLGLPGDVVCGRVVPVGLVDLQPLPPGTNLFFHLAGQLSRLVDAIDEGGLPADTRRDAWNPTKSAEPASRLEWRQFVQAVAAGWDGRLETRRGALDPEAFAVEFEEAERHRLDVPERFRALADALVGDYQAAFRQVRGAPFFVIPIDDADMNLEASRALLDLLRTLWHPRVGFLLTGQSSLFREALKDDLMRNKPGSTSSSSAVDKLGDAIYAKVVPSHQRFGLRHLPYAERLEIIRETLRRVQVFENPLRPANLLDYLQVNRLAGRILPENVRELRDWEVWVARRGFDLGFEDARAYRIRDDETRTGSLFARLTGEGASDLEVASDISANRDGHHGFYAEMMLSQDARREGIEERIRLPLGRTTRDGAAFEWPSPRWTSWLEHAAFAYLLRHVFDVETVEVLDFRRDEYGWYSARSKSSFPRDEAVRAYLTWILRFMEFRRERSGGSVGQPLREALDELLQRAGAGAWSWDEILDRITRAHRDSGLSAAERDWVAIGVALFAAPEHRLGHEIANELLQHVRGLRPDDWKDTTAVLRTLRLQHVGKESRDYGGEKKPFDAVAFSERVDAQSSRYEWVIEVSRLEGPKDELYGLLRQFQSPPPQGGSAISLTVYFIEERWLTLQRTTTEELRRRWTERLAVLPKGGVSAPLAVAALWNEAIRAGAAPKLRPLEGDLKLEELRSRFELLGLTPWTLRQKGAAVEVGALHVALVELGWSESTGFNGSLDGVLFEVLWDVLADVSNRSATTPGALPWWDAVGVSYEELGGRCPWPFPAWPSFLDTHMFAASYNAQVRRIRDALSALPAKVDISPSVADYYVRALVAIYWQRGAMPEWAAQPAVFIWEEIFANHQQSRQAGARADAYDRWLRRVPLLAAPESGLPPDTAAAILLSANPDQAWADELRTARRERLQHAGMRDEVQVGSALARIDAQFEGHPWVRRMGAVKAT